MAAKRTRCRNVINEDILKDIKSWRRNMLRQQNQGGGDFYFEKSIDRSRIHTLHSSQSLYCQDAPLIIFEVNYGREI